MRKLASLAVTFVSVAIVLSPTKVDAATIFFDDFEDGDHLDGAPVTWSWSGPDPDDEEMVVDGSLVLVSTGINGGYNFVGEADHVLADTSIRMQATGGTQDLVSASVRNMPQAFGYWARVSAAGELAVGCCGERFMEVQTDLRPETEDVILQFDAFGSQLSFWAWRLGDEMPDTPQITVTDGRRTAGVVGLSVWNWPWSDEPVEGVFRYAHVADVHIHPGDFDNNGQVNNGDLLTWEQNFGMQSGAAPADGDADYDGDVDGFDFLMWQREYGPTTLVSTSALPEIPEPMPWMLLLAFILAVTCHYRMVRT